MLACWSLTGPDMISEPAMISAVVLAAGASRRMGQPKMLLPWGNTVVIQKVVSTVLDGGVSLPVIVTGRSAEELKRAIRSQPVIWVHNPDYETTEMLQSLQMGLRSLPEGATAFLIVLGDQPQIETGVIRQITAEFETHHPAIIIPSYQFRRGHPWLVSRDLLPELLEMPEGATLRQFLNAHSGTITYLNVENPAVLMDLDTPADYERQKPPDTKS